MNSFLVGKSKQMTERRLEYENLGQKGYVQVVFEEKTGGFVVIHSEHGRYEWAQNEEIARLLAALGEAIILMPAKSDTTCFDAMRNGEDWEFKTVKSWKVGNALQNAIRRGKKQASSILCFIDSDGWEIAEITLGIFTAIKFDARAEAQRLAILFRSGKLVEMSREDVRKGNFIHFFDP